LGGRDVSIWLSIILFNYKKKLESYDKIIKSFNNPKTKDFISLYFTNDAINTTELQYVLPIYL